MVSIEALVEFCNVLNGCVEMCGGGGANVVVYPRAGTAPAWNGGDTAVAFKVANFLWEWDRFLHKTAASSSETLKGDTGVDTFVDTLAKFVSRIQGDSDLFENDRCKAVLEHCKVLQKRCIDAASMKTFGRGYATATRSQTQTLTGGAFTA